jgi:Cof subfamily protein (haloacid dehalogenase superfamily)
MRALPNIQMLGLDLDGTLLDSNKQMTSLTVEKIRQAQNKGVVVVPVTGRPESGIPDDMRHLFSDGYAITSSGAVTTCWREKRIIAASYISAESVSAIMNVLSMFTGSIEVFTGGFGYVSEYYLEKLIQRYIATPLASYMKKSRRPVADIFAFTTECVNIEEITVAVPFGIDGKNMMKLLKQIASIQFVVSDDSYLEINAQSANKGTALLHLAGLLGYEKSAVMACGDDSGDLSMIRSVGTGIAMGNAKDVIKQAAVYVTRSNDQDGVAYAIDNFILAGKMNK